MKKIIYNIGTLAGILQADVRRLEGEAMNHVECIENAYLVIEDGIIAEFGKMADAGGRSFADAQDDRERNGQEGNTEYIDAKGGFVMPAFCDSHTHIVYAGCRSKRNHGHGYRSGRDKERIRTYR